MILVGPKFSSGFTSTLNYLINPAFKVCYYLPLSVHKIKLVKKEKRPGVNFINVLRKKNLYEHRFLVTFWVCQKIVMLMKLTAKEKLKTKEKWKYEIKNNIIFAKQSLTETFLTFF